jgi:hypothetical protein
MNSKHQLMSMILKKYKMVANTIVLNIEFCDYRVIAKQPLHLFHDCSVNVHLERLERHHLERLERHHLERLERHHLERHAHGLVRPAL